MTDKALLSVPFGIGTAGARARRRGATATTACGSSSPPTWRSQSACVLCVLGRGGWMGAEAGRLRYPALELSATALLWWRHSPLPLTHPAPPCPSALTSAAASSTTSPSQSLPSPASMPTGPALTCPSTAAVAVRVGVPEAGGRGSRAEQLVGVRVRGPPSRLPSIFNISPGSQPTHSLSHHHSLLPLCRHTPQPAQQHRPGRGHPCLPRWRRQAQR